MRKLREPKSAYLRQIRAVRSAMLASTDSDPLLSFDECIAALGTSSSSFFRTIRHELETVAINARSYRVKRSELERYKASRVRPATRSADEAAAIEAPARAATVGGGVATAKANAARKAAATAAADPPPTVPGAQPRRRKVAA